MQKGEGLGTRLRERFAISYCVDFVAVLDGEVLDLRVCLQSADRELNELKTEKQDEKKAHESRVMEHIQRVSP